MTGSQQTTAQTEGPAWSAGAPGWVEHWEGSLPPLDAWNADARTSIGAAGFEPATFRPQTECATRLRHAP